MLARETHLEAVRAAIVAGRSAQARSRPPRGPRGAARRPGGPRPVDLLSTGWRCGSPTATPPAAPALKRALAALCEEGEGRADSVRWPWYGRRVAPELFDDEALALPRRRAACSWRARAARSRCCRSRSTISRICAACEGDLDGAAALLDEADDIAAATGIEPLLDGG